MEISISLLRDQSTDVVLACRKFRVSATARRYRACLALTKARAGVAFLPSSAKAFVPVGVVLRPASCSIRPLQTFALSRGGMLTRLFSACSIF